MGEEDIIGQALQLLQQGPEVSSYHQEQTQVAAEGVATKVDVVDRRVPPGRSLPILLMATKLNRSIRAVIGMAIFDVIKRPDLNET